MKNLCMSLVNRPGALADVGESLGRAGVSIEGGGMFVVDDRGIANFLVDDGDTGRQALHAAGIEVSREEDVVIVKLNQDEPGQLGKLLRRMANAEVNVLTQYSDHNHQLVLVVDNFDAGQAVANAWMQERAARNTIRSAAVPARTRSHHYSVHISWKGNTGSGTSSYASYSRNHEILGEEKGVIEGSSDPAFRGAKTRYNPEELLLASVSACHMLSYLHMCAVNGVVVLSYEDRSTAEMEEVVGGSGALIRVDLHPIVTVAPESEIQRAEALHEEAHKNCFIANTLKVPVFAHPLTRTLTHDQ